MALVASTNKRICNTTWRMREIADIAGTKPVYSKSLIPKIFNVHVIALCPHQGFWDGS